MDKSIYASTLLKQRIWPDFIAHFKSQTTKGSYRADIEEIMTYFKKDFLELKEKEIEEYFTWMEHRVKQGVIKPGTMAKKFREFHSFAEYICEKREGYGIDEAYEDFYYPYLKLVAKQEKYAKCVPVEHIDKLLSAAQGNLMAYCIVVLLYRVGLTSTEITELKIHDIAQYENGVYMQITGRNSACYVPEDVVLILNEYLSSRMENPYLFYNKRGKKLNTMYISRMMRRYTEAAGIPGYSAENIRSTCGFTMFAYGAKKEHVAEQMGVTQIQIERYHNIVYRENLQREASRLVKLKVEPPFA